MQTTTRHTVKAKKTRSVILETALRLFLQHGYEQTTMRSIAQEAGVSLGAAYYYFNSKEDLIQAFYGRTHAEHALACRELLESERDFGTRLRGVLGIRIATNRPYHRFAGVLFKTAADPASPLNPFSHASLPVRREATELFAQVVRGSHLRLSETLASSLPNLLWLYQMGIILFWVHDQSPDNYPTRQLIEHSVDLVTGVIKLANLPPFRPLVRRTIHLVTLLQGATP